jgi:hypothetical protein
MTTQQAQPQTQAPTQPRGAGTGEQANIKRRFSDPAAVIQSHKEHVEELVAVAEENENFNNEMNELQTDLGNKFAKVQAAMQQGDPLNDDDERTRAREAYINEADPDKRGAIIKAQRAARAKARTATAAK